MIREVLTVAARALVSLGIVLAASARYEPTVLSVEFVGGERLSIPATSPESCQGAVRAIHAGLWQPADEPPITAVDCRPGNLFRPDEMCIKGYHGPRAEGYCR